VLTGCKSHHITVAAVPADFEKSYMRSSLLS